MSHMNEVYPGLWIGDIYSSTNKEFLIKYEITFIINCTCTMPFSDLEGLKKVRIPVLDDLKSDQIYKMYTLLDKATKLIYKILPKRNILVHCHAGRQRSAAVITAFLMRYAHLRKNDAIRLLKTKRKNISILSNFDAALNQFDKDLFN